jgi:hypothetical protein
MPLPPFDAVPRPFPLDPLGGTSAPRVIDFLPWVFPPVNFIPFDVVDVQTVNAGITAVVNIIDSQAQNAVIRWFGNETTLAGGLADILWTILISGVGYQPYVNMQLTRGFIDNPDPIIIRIPQNRLVQVAIQNTSGVNNWEVRTRVKGWLY